jgi:hypothetical protein
LKISGLIEQCRLWIESYALRTKTLYSKLLEEETDPLCWEPEDLQIIESLKQSLIMAPLLSLEKPFHLFVNVDKGTALGVLTQEEKKNRWPIYPNFLIL